MEQRKKLPAQIALSEAYRSYSLGKQDLPDNNDHETIDDFLARFDPKGSQKFIDTDELQSGGDLFSLKQVKMGRYY